MLDNSHWLCTSMGRTLTTSRPSFGMRFVLVMDNIHSLWLFVATSMSFSCPKAKNKGALNLDGITCAHLLVQDYSLNKPRKCGCGFMCLNGQVDLTWVKPVASLWPRIGTLFLQELTNLAYSGLDLIMFPFSWSLTNIPFVPCLFKYIMPWSLPEGYRDLIEEWWDVLTWMVIVHASQKICHTSGAPDEHGPKRSLALSPCERKLSFWDWITWTLLKRIAAYWQTNQLKIQLCD